MMAEERRRSERGRRRVLLKKRCVFSSEPANCQNLSLLLKTSQKVSHAMRRHRASAVVCLRREREYPATPRYVGLFESFFIAQVQCHGIVY